ncbi:MAG: PEGA domain-containing protein [Planctomycetota bacterium]
MWRRLAIAAVLGVLTSFGSGWGSAAAQTADATFNFPTDPITSAGSLTVISEPSGAVITLYGRQLKVAGRTPWSVSRGIEGPYIVTAELPGYERWERTIYVDPMARDTLRVKFSAKTRLKAAARSLIIPGWGQRYSDHSGRAWAFLLSEIAAGGAWLWAEDRYRDRRDDLEAARDFYAEATQVEQQATRWLVVQKRLGDAQDADDDRKLVTAIVGGIYAINVLDAFFSFPERRFATFAEAAPLAPGSSLASADPEHVRLGLRYRF